MKKFVALFLIALMFCAVISVGCGGGSSDSDQTENLTDDTGSYDPNDNTDDYDPNEEGRGDSGVVSSGGSISVRIKEKIFTATSSYVAFGFEVDVARGRSWPYSGVFWTAEDTAKKGTPSKIDIELG